MPGKHVRFARNNTIHTFSKSTLPPTPALVYDAYSPPSSDSLITPPDHTFPLPSTSSHPHYPAPSSVKRSQSLRQPSEVRLHHLLKSSSDPELRYDVRQPLAKLGSKRRVITPDELNDPATSTRTSSMTLIHKYLPWSIRVQASGYSRSRNVYYVTVWDVLKAIDSSLRTKIKQEDYDRLGAGSNHQTRVKKAYENRYRMYSRNSSAYHDEKMGGVLRVDFLVEFIRFTGLIPHNVERGEYFLNTESLTH